MKTTITKVTKFTILKWITEGLLMYVFINLLDNLGQYNSYQLPGQLIYFSCFGVFGGVFLVLCCFTTLIMIYFMKTELFCWVLFHKNINNLFKILTEILSTFSFFGEENVTKKPSEYYIGSMTTTYQLLLDIAFATYPILLLRNRALWFTFNLPVLLFGG